MIRPACSINAVLVVLALSAGSSQVASADPLDSNSKGSNSKAGLEAKSEASFSLSDARHLLIRAGFGGTQEAVQRLHRLGLTGMVNWLVDYESRPDLVGDLTLERPAPVDFREVRAMSEQERRRWRQQRRREDQQRFNRVRNWWMDRMLMTRRPLEEKMTLFWHGHFTTGYREVRRSFLILKQNKLLRQQATANFAELLHDVSKDPAMLLYLNNNQNRKGRANENYAREVMELFSLGVGNYTEKDIQEAARAFTGWQINRQTGEFWFNTRQHDFGIKTFLGKTGRLGGEDVLDQILAHPACGPYIARQIFSFFAYGNPDDELVNELGAYFKSVNYEIKPVLRKIFKSKAFYSDKAKGTRVKSPLLLMISTVRMLGMNPPPSALLLGVTARLGQNLLQPPNVKGWEGGLAWITTATMLDRSNFCAALVKGGDRSLQQLMQEEARDEGRDMRDNPMASGRRGRRRGNLRALRQMRNWDSGLNLAALVSVLDATNTEQLVDGFIKRFLFVPLPQARKQALMDFVSGKDGSRELDFKNLSSTASEYKLRKLLHLLMSAPEFQVC